MPVVGDIVPDERVAPLPFDPSPEKSTVNGLALLHRWPTNRHTSAAMLPEKLIVAVRPAVPPATTPRQMERL
jgi:hypothetical protein